MHNNARINDLFQRFPSLLKLPQYHVKPPHDVEHHIETHGPPVYQKPRRLQPAITRELRDEIKRFKETGLIQDSKSQWASPLVAIKKTGKKTRFAGDYRLLNGRTLPDRYPLPDLRDSTQCLTGKRFFSNLDLVRAFHNIPVHAKDRVKTAITSSVGFFEYIRMPLGLRNAPATFQRFVNAILADLPYVFIYIDDILVFSKTEEEHYQHLEEIFARLAKYGLSLNVTKSSFCLPEVNFLGHKIKQGGYLPTDERVRYLSQLKKPKTIEALRSIIGTFNFYRIFKRQAAAILAPLNEVLKGRTKRRDRTPVQWTPELSLAFDKAKELFSTYTLLHYPRENCTLILSADASGTAIGAVLEQVNKNGECEPIGFFSRKLDQQQQQWPTYDCELYALYSAVEYFECLVEGRHLILATDHKPLTNMFVAQRSFKLQRRSRQVQYLSQFTNEIIHIAGINNVIADQLSRPEAEVHTICKALEFDFTMPAFASAQRDDTETQTIRKNGLKDHTISDIICDDGQTVLCSVFKGKNRPIVPQVLRSVVFNKLHGIAHPGLKATQRLISDRYYWPGLKKDVRTWHKACEPCQKNKITRHTKAPFAAFPPSDRFEHVHMDIVILKSSKGYKYLCTFTDRSTRWLEAVPMKDITAETVARAFVENWVARFGVPSHVTTDRGAQFTSALFGEISKLLGSRQVLTTAYNPKANGIIERRHRQLKAALMCRGGEWIEFLPAVLLGLRAAPRDENGISCAEMTYGTSLRLPREIFENSSQISDTHAYVKKLRQTFREVRPAPFKHRPRGQIFMHPDLMKSSKVYVRRDRVKAPLEAPYDGPFTVIKRNNKWFRLNIDGTQQDINIDRLKPAYTLDETEKKESNTVMEPKIKTTVEVDFKTYDNKEKARAKETRKNTTRN